MPIPFNHPHLIGKEAHYMYDAVYEGKLSGNGKYTKLCQQFFEERYGFGKCLLTTSCTDALEMAALNTLKNKIIHRIMAVVRDDRRMYEKNYPLALA